MKTGKNFFAERNDFTEPCFSESSIGITEKCASARFSEMYHGSVKSDIPTCEQDITPLNLSGFTINRIFHHTAKPVYQRVHLNRMKEQIMTILNDSNPFNKKAKAEE